MIRTIILAILLSLSLLGLAEAATNHSHKHNVDKSLSECSDPQKPARLLCAPAPSSQFDEQGKLWIVWSYAGHVYVTFSDDKGKTFNPSVVVNRVPEAISARGENRPKIVVRQKKIYISWTTPLAKRFTGNVRFSYSDDGGKNFSRPITVNDNLDITGHRFDALSVNEQGTVFLAWLDKRDRFKAKQKGEKYHGAALYYTYSEDGGKTFRSNMNVMPHTCECCRVVMEIDDEQNPVILWRNIYGANIRDHSLVKFTAKDQPGEVLRVSHDNWHIDACPHHGPALTIEKSKQDETETYHLVWFNNAPKRHGIFYANMKEPRQGDKTQMKEPVNIGNYAKGASHADILSNNQKVWLVWKEFNGDNESIFAQVSQDSGSSWSQPVIVAQTKNGSDYPFLINDKEKIYVQWQIKDEGFKLFPLN